jgi:hypothetical protein
MTTLGYKYQTEQEAQQTRKQCADYYGLPKASDDVTQYWVDYQYAYDNWVISIEEMTNCVNPQFVWVKDLDLIIYEPKVYPFPDL